MEIPGLANENIFQIVRETILTILQKCTNKTLLNYLDNDNTNICSNSNNDILINSNFNCGFFIQRDFLYSKYVINKYGIETSYDPYNYPGIKCIYYYKNKEVNIHVQNGCVDSQDNKLKLKNLNDCKKYIEISFMIFITKSYLIVGNCNATIIHFVFIFIFCSRRRTCFILFHEHFYVLHMILFKIIPYIRHFFINHICKNFLSIFCLII